MVPETPKPGDMCARGSEMHCATLCQQCSRVSPVAPLAAITSFAGTRSALSPGPHPSEGPHPKAEGASVTSRLPGACALASGSRPLLQSGGQPGWLCSCAARVAALLPFRTLPPPDAGRDVTTPVAAITESRALGVEREEEGSGLWPSIEGRARGPAIAPSNRQ
ncbi:hypothetical protein HJG60_008719 [Phyllostomus discolor]|uniref:Uncharacterized protein n=1 Tax=Phyllostomus discolor TaxID=89673 RepID=A0A834DI24_9CHIR|nr:hypothetical protein HJG60_008719 [Phyllostomus discolor]